MAAMSSKTPPTTMPTRRKGRRSSQTKGKRTNATRAAGQQMTRRMRKRSSFMVELRSQNSTRGGGGWFREEIVGLLAPLKAVCQISAWDGPKIRKPARVSFHAIQSTVWIFATLSNLQGIENENVAPGPSLAVAHKRPLWRSIMERLTNRPIPIPSLLVV